jgi:hypothetical protein
MNWTPHAKGGDNRVHKASRDLTFTWRDGTIIDDEQDPDDDDSLYDPTDDDAFSDSDESGDDGSDFDSDDEPDNDEDDDDALSFDDENIDEGDDQIIDPIDAPFAGVVGDEDNVNEGDSNEDENNDENNDEGRNNEPPVLGEAPIISEDEGASADQEDNDDNDEEIEIDKENEHNNESNKVTPAKAAGVRFSETDNDTGVSKPEQVAAGMDAQYGHRSGQYVLRQRKRPNREYLCEDETQFFMRGDEIVIGPRDCSHEHNILENVVMTQHWIEKGLKIFGQDGENAVISEMQQLHDMECIEPRKGAMLTREEKQAALNYLMFLKKKRCGRIKGRGCDDGRKQRLYKTKEETSAPTVAIESVFLTSVVDAKEGRRVITLDIPGAFMQTDIDEVIHVRLEGAMARLLVKVNPKLYEQYLEKDRNGKPVMYVKLEKALYGTLQAAMLFLKDLTGTTLVDMGFEVNPYDMCVANKTINGKQCTIVWHVDDLKISHMESDVLEDIVDQLNKKYGTINPLVVTQGDVHDYLGMRLDFTEPGKVKVNMENYIQEMLDELPADMAGTATSPAADYLLAVDPECERLEEGLADLYHPYTVKLLFLSKRARPDL